MKLHDYILQSVYLYPSLYLCETYEDSRILVLNQLFLVNGNRIEWAYTKNPQRGGYLVSPKHYKRNGEWERKLDLPYGKQKFSIEWNDLLGYGITEELEPSPSLSEIRERFDKFCKKRGIINKLKQDSIEKTCDRAFKNISIMDTKYKKKPYPYYDKGWPFYDVKNGNQKLEFIKPDWLEGMIGIKEWAIKFYEDKENYHNDYYEGSTEKSIKSYQETIEKGFTNGTYKNWQNVLDAYLIKGEVKEFDYKSLVNTRTENNRLGKIKGLQDAINFLKNS